MRASCRFSSPPDPLQVFTKLSLLSFSSVLNFSDVKVISKLLKIALMREHVFLAVFTFFGCFALAIFSPCYVIEAWNVTCFVEKKIKRDFLHGKKNVAKELRDKPWALFQSSPKLNCMLITRLICIRRKSVTILIPSFHDLRWERVGLWPTNWERPKEKKKACVFRVSLC